MNLEIVDKQYHENVGGVPFVIAIVDDPTHNDTKLVIMFDEEEYTAVLSLDTLLESEDISPEGNSHPVRKYEQALRSTLWELDEDYDIDDYDPLDESEMFE